MKNLFQRFFYQSVALIVIFAISMIFYTEFNIESKPLGAVLHSIATGLLASSIFAVLMRYLVLNDIDDLVIGRIDEALKSNIRDVADSVSKTIDLKIKSIQSFMPDEPIVNRTNAFDIAEFRVRELLKNALNYESFGITAKYTSLRITELINNIEMKQSIEVRIFVAHPAWIRPGLIRDPNKKLLELIGSLNELSKLPEWLDVEVYFIAPVPAFRVDRVDNRSVVFMYSHSQRETGALPDAGIYSADSYWFRSIRSFLADERRKAILSWRIHGDLFKHETETGDVERVVRNPDFDGICEHFNFTEEKIKDGLLVYSSFAVEMAERTRVTP